MAMPCNQPKISKRLRCSTMSAVAALTATMTVPSHAQAADPQSGPGALDEILVTAERRETRLQDTPVAVTAIGGDALATSQTNNIQDIQHQVPSLVVTSNTAFGQPYIRGVGNEILAGLNDSAVAVHLNGIYVPRASSLIFDFFDVERVEVLRGPQGTLYGRNATGGSINVIAKQPGFDPDASIRLTYGNYNNVRVTAGAGGALIGDTLAARASLLVDRRDGFQRNLFDGGDLQDKDVVAGRLALLYRSGDWRVTLSGDYSADDSNGSGTRELSGDPALAPSLAFGGQSALVFWDVNLDVPTDQHMRNYGVALTVERSGTVNVKSITAYRRSKFSLLLDQDSTSLPSIATINSFQNSHSVSQELQVSGESERFDWIAGLFYFNERAEDLQNLDFGFPFTAAGFDAILLEGAGETNAYASYGQGTLKLGGGLGLTAGVRLTHEKKRGLSSLELNGTRQPDVPGEVKTTRVTPKLGVEYRFSEQGMLFASVTNGFKSGGINTIALTRETYGPEAIWAYEVGLKADWLDRRLRTNIGAFWYDYSDLQVSQFNQGLTQVENAASARIRGVEVELVAVPVSGLTLSASGAYLDATFRRYETLDPDRGAVVDLSGGRLPRAPEWSYSLSADYVVAIGDGELSLRADYQWRDSVFYNQFQDARRGQDAFSLLNASATYRFEDGLSVGIWGRNLANTKWYDFVGGASGLNGIVAIPAAPRTYGITLGFDF